MGNVKRLFAAIGVAVVATVSLPAMASATPPPGCNGMHNGSNYGWAQCSAYGNHWYRAYVTHCNPVCGRANGNWKRHNEVSEVFLKAPSTITDLGVEIL